MVKICVEQKTLLDKFTKSVKCNIFKTYCYLLYFHQQIHRGKSLSLSCVIDPVVSVNFIQSHGLNHDQFYEFLSEIDPEVLAMCLSHASQN